MTEIRLATALVRREDAVLLVASRYANHPEPLWNLPGGRQQPRELLASAALRELREETGLSGTIRRCAYVSESFDGDVHVLNVTFEVEAIGEPAVQTRPGDHVAAVAWAPAAEIAARMQVEVVREPLLAYLTGGSSGYTGYERAGITIVFPPDV